MARAKKNETTVEETAPETAEGEATETTAAAEGPKRLDIINGRMPIPLVHLIRFDEVGSKDSEVAAKFFTSTGKVSDIKKNRNFQYVTEDMKFTQADIDAAKEFIARPSLNGNHIAEDVQAKISAALDTLPVDENAAAALTEARKATRATKPAKTEEAAPEEGEASEGGSLEDAM